MLIDITAALFPYRELAIRLPNLLMCAVYLWLAICVSRRYQSRPLVFGLLALNYFLDEFFGLARGYALCAGLVCAALAVSPEGPEDERSLRLSFWLLLLASLANYAAVALLAAFGLEALLWRGPRFVARALFVPSSLAGGLVLCWILYAFAAVSEAGKPLFGDTTQGFWDPVVGGYLRMFVPEWAPPLALLVSLGCVFLALLAPQWAGRFRSFQLGRCLLLLLALVTTASHLLGKPMPMGRVLLPFWPLVALSIGAAADFHARWLIGRRRTLAGPIHVAFLLALAGLVWSFARQADPTATQEWRDDYVLASAVRGPLERGDCIKRRYVGHPVTTFYVKKFGRDPSDPSFVCPKPQRPALISR
jgi:hypothetical protein